MKSLFKEMFREYDIRGRISDDQMNLDNLAIIVKGFAKYLDKRGIDKIVVGYDNRPNSEEFSKLCCDIMCSLGFTVYDIGLSISPSLYFAQYHLQCEGGIMITASHNPSDWAGLKLCNGYSKTLVKEDIDELYTLCLYKETLSKKEGKIIKKNVRNAYLDMIINKVGDISDNPLKVVLDAGNGGAGVFIYELFQRLGIATFQLNCDPDMTYPHYFPDPSDVKARERMAEMVNHPYIKADLGLSFDGDGDRLGIYSPKSGNIWSDRVLMLLAKEILIKYPNASIVYDVKSSRALGEAIKSLGGKPVMWKTGHSHIKQKMNELSAPLAGERSGHIFVGGDIYYGFDDALMAAALLVKIIKRTGKSIDDLLGEFNSYITSSEIRIPCDDSIKYQLIDKITKGLVNKFGDKVNTINGARVEFTYGFGLIRASSNLPEFVLIFEGERKSDLLDIREIFKEEIDKYPELIVPWENDIV